MAADPRRYDCSTCALNAQLTALWRVNLEAWRIFQTLCGRTVGRYDLERVLLERITEAWPIEDVLDLVSRVDVILEVLSPQASTDGSRSARVQA